MEEEAGRYGEAFGADAAKSTASTARWLRDARYMPGVNSMMNGKVSLVPLPFAALKTFAEDISFAALKI